MCARQWTYVVLALAPARCGKIEVIRRLPALSIQRRSSRSPSHAFCLTVIDAASYHPSHIKTVALRNHESPARRLPQPKERIVIKLDIINRIDERNGVPKLTAKTATES